jgi:hypothetical protein
MAIIEINWKPSAKDLRIFAGLEAVFFGIVAAWLYRRGVSPAIAAGIFAVAAAVGIMGLARPACIRPVYIAWMAAVFPVGWLVSHALLAVVFYLLFLPVGLLMRLFGRDPLERKFDSRAPTYWKRRETPETTARYFKQY